MRRWSNDAFAGYVAGMLDGEGSIEIIGAHSVRVRIANTHQATLDAMQRRLGFGKVWAYKRRVAHWKQLFALQISNAIDLKVFFEICGPFVWIKRAKMRKALAIIGRVLGEAERIDSRNRGIMAALRGGARNKDVAVRFGISPQLVSHIKVGRSWPSVQTAHVARQLSKKFPRRMSQVFRMAAQ